MATRILRPVSLLSLAMILAAAAPVRAQAGAEAGCDRMGTTWFRFGLTGGELEPGATEITAAGAVRHSAPEGAGPTLRRVPRDSVRALARRGWRGGFGALRPAPTSPSADATVPRRFIELHSACGMHHVEYVPGTESRLFRELYGRLTRLAGPAVRRR